LDANTTRHKYLKNSFREIKVKLGWKLWMRYKLTSTSSNLLIFIGLLIIIPILQFYLLKPALEIGFKPDDRIIYFGYKVIGPNPLSKIAEVWHERGLHTTYQVYYLGLLEILVGLDHQAFQTINLFFKTLAILAVFPVVLVIFKDRLLVFLTAILYAISHASVGPLEFTLKGSDYLAIFWMCIFLTVYYTIVKNHKINLPWLGLGLILLVLTIVFSPIRLYPLLILLPLVELFLLMTNRKITNLKNSLIRMLVLYSPFIGLTIISPNLTLEYLQGRFGIYKSVIEGNWHLILSPFSGIGYTFITAEWGKIFGLVRLDNLGEYLLFLSGGPTVIFGILTVIMAFLHSKKPRTFFLFVFVLNFILEILVFFIATHSQYLPKEQGLPYDSTGFHAALLGIYISILGLAFFREWLQGKRGDNLLLAFWIAPLYLFIFVFATWSLEPYGINFSPTSYYLVVAAIGASLMVSVFLVATLYKILLFKSKLLRTIFLPPLLLIIISIFSMSSGEIQSRFSYFLENGRSAEGQRLLQDRFKQKIKDIDLKNPILFYFDTSGISSEGSFYGEGFLSGFPYWMYFEGNILKEGCTEVLYFANHNDLVKFIKDEKGKKGFFYRSLCVGNGKSNFKEIFYELENFYAFKLKNRDFINIKEEILQELGLAE